MENRLKDVYFKIKSLLMKGVRGPLLPSKVKFALEQRIMYQCSWAN